jgi:ATP-dependent DNA helicase RecG
VPLDNEYSFDAGTFKAQNKAQLKHSNGDDDCALTERTILEYLSNHPRATQNEIAGAVKKTRRGVQEAIARLKEKGLLEREGAKKNGRWVIHD